MQHPHEVLRLISDGFIIAPHHVDLLMTITRNLNSAAIQSRIKELETLKDSLIHFSELSPETRDSIPLNHVSNPLGQIQKSLEDHFIAILNLWKNDTVQTH